MEVWQLYLLHKDEDIELNLVHTLSGNYKWKNISCVYKVVALGYLRNQNMGGVPKNFIPV